MPKLAGFDDRLKLPILERRGDEASITMAFHRVEPRTILFGHGNAPIARERLSVRFARNIVAGDKIGDRFRPQRDDRRICFLRATHQNAGQGRLRVLIDDFSSRGFHAAVNGKTCFAQHRFIIGRERQMIDPFEEIGCGFVAHPFCEVLRKSILRKKGFNAPAQECLGFIGQRPIKARNVFIVGISSHG